MTGLASSASAADVFRCPGRTILPYLFVELISAESAYKFGYGSFQKSG